MYNLDLKSEELGLIILSLNSRKQNIDKGFKEMSYSKDEAKEMREQKEDIDKLLSKIRTSLIMSRM